MKRLFSILLVLITSSFLFAQAVSYNEGRVKVAGIGELPSGLFAKAKGYLPGDTITLTNSISGKEVKLLNLGTPDIYDGVVILVSKEAGDALGISKKDNLDIRIPDRKGNLEESVSSQGLLKKSSSKLTSFTSDEEYQDSEEDFDAYKASLEKPSPAEVSESGGKLQEKPAEKPQNNVKETPQEAEPFINDEEFPAEKQEENNDKISEPYVDDSDDNPDEPEADLTVPAASNEVPAEKIEDGSFDNSSEDSENPANSAEKFDAEDIGPVSEEKENVPYSPESDKNGEGVSANEKVTGEKEPEPESVPSQEQETKGVEEVPYSPEKDKEGEKVLSNEKVKGEKEPEKYVPEEDKPGEAVNKNENVEYAPIILVPVEEKAPEHTEEVVKIVPEEETKVTPVEEVREPDSSESELKDYIVTLENIKKTDYYIQIANLSDADGIKALIKKYKKYDIVLLRNTNGTYKVLVGPLTVDEYGAILKKFKSYGFKDAFLFKKK